jgi:hypothetical protein
MRLPVTFSSLPATGNVSNNPVLGGGRVVVVVEDHGGKWWGGVEVGRGE